MFRDLGRKMQSHDARACLYVVVVTGFELWKHDLFRLVLKMGLNKFLFSNPYSFCQDSIELSLIDKSAIFLPRLEPMPLDR